MNDTFSTIVDPAKFQQARLELGVNFSRILGYFREDGAKSLAQINDALQDRNAAALVRPAHTLKGESLMFGAEQLALAAETIEKAARDAVERQKFPHHIASEAVRLESLFAQTLAFFDREVVAAAPIRRSLGFGRKVA